MNKRIIWPFILVLVIVLAVGIIVPALAKDNVPAVRSELKSGLSMVVSTVPFAAADDFAPKTISIIKKDEKSPVKKVVTYKVPAKRAVVKKTAVAKKKINSHASDLSTARSVLASLKAKYEYLSGVTVEMGNAQGYQAVSYYSNGRIVISPSHSASISRILNHEIWHIIDWRDNGKINWRESVPPHNASSYLK